MRSAENNSLLHLPCRPLQGADFQWIWPAISQGFSAPRVPTVDQEDICGRTGSSKRSYSSYVGFYGPEVGAALCALLGCAPRDSNKAVCATVAWSAEEIARAIDRLRGGGGGIGAGGLGVTQMKKLRKFRNQKLTAIILTSPPASCPIAGPRIGTHRPDS